MSTEYTANTFAKAIGVEKDAAYNLLRFLVSIGLATNVGSKRVDGATKGRGENHYTINDVAREAIRVMLKVSL